MDTQKYKQSLLDEKSRLTEELSRISSPKPENPADWDAMPESDTKEADLNVAADMHEEVEERHGTSDELEKRLADVNAALARIEAGTYGVCGVCGGAIESARLDSDATAATCVAHRN